MTNAQKNNLSSQPATTALSETCQKKLTIVIPAFNECKAIAKTVSELKARFPKAEIIVVDDGSSDGTADQVKTNKQTRLLQHTINRGYGASLKTAMKASNRDYVAWFDADNEHRVEDLERIVARLYNANFVAVIGERQKRSPSIIRHAGKLIITMLGRTLNIDIGEDLNCGLRVFKRQIITRYLSLLPDGYSASMTSLIIMLERGYPIAFEPIDTNKRIGKSKVQLIDGMRTILLLLRLVMLFAPLRIFVGTGTILLTLGFSYSLVIATTFWTGVPIMGAVLIIIGVLIFLLGLLADQISQIRMSGIYAQDDNFTKEIKQEHQKKPSIE